MRLATTLFLLAFVGALAIFVARFDPKFLSTKERLAAKNLAIPIKSNLPEAIELSSKDQRVALRRTGNVWRVESPFEDRANPTLTADLLKQLSEITWTETFHRSDLHNGDWKHSGLGDATAVEVALTQSGGNILRIKFGNPGALEGSVYASLPDTSKDEIIHLAKSGVAPLLRKPAQEWRDPKLLRLNLASIKRFTMSAGSGVLDFTREPKGSWMLVKPLQTRASDERVNGVLAAFLAADAKPRQTPIPPSSEAAAPVMKVTLEAEGSSPVEITLHPAVAPDPAPMVSVSDRAGVFTVPARLADIWRLQPNDLRDQHLARIDGKAVTSLKIRSMGFPEVKLARTGELWMLNRHSTNTLADAVRLRQFLETLNNSTVLEFVTDAPGNLAQFGLDHPFQEVEWSTKDKTTLLQFGHPVGYRAELEEALNPPAEADSPESKGLNRIRVTQIGDSASNYAYAKYAGEPFIFRINPALLSAIPPDGQKWRGLSVLNLSIFGIHRIVVAEGPKPATILNYDPSESSWTAEIAGRDVTALLVRPSANGLLNRLANFQATDWVTDHSSAYAALKQPTLTVQVLVSDLSNPKAPLKAHTLYFAPTTPGYDTAVYHGRLDDDLDTFMISKDQYHELTAPVVKAEF